MLLFAVLLNSIVFWHFQGHVDLCTVADSGFQSADTLAMAYIEVAAEKVNLRLILMVMMMMDDDG